MQEESEAVEVSKVADANAPSLEPEAVAVEIDANAPFSDTKLNSLERESALEPDPEQTLVYLKLHQ